MGITGAEWKNIDDRIANQLATMREALRQELRPKGFHAFFHEARESILVALILAICGFVIYKDLPSRIESQTNSLRTDVGKLTTSVEDLSKQANRIEDRITSVLKAELKDNDGPAGGGGPKAKKSSLNRSKRAIELANAFGVGLGSTLVADFGQEALQNNVEGKQKLLRNISEQLTLEQRLHPNEVDVWRDTAKFISYRTDALVSPYEIANFSLAQRISCGSMTAGSQMVTMKDCSMDLDAFNVVGKPVIFINCVIRYRGGPIRIGSMKFVNCRFEFAIGSIPSPQGRSLIAQIAAETSPVINVKESG